MKQWTDEQRAIFDEVDKGQQHVVVRARAGCLAADTQIGINRGGKGSQVSIEHLAKQSNGVQPLFYRKSMNIMQRMRAWDLSIPTLVRRADEGVVRLGHMKAAWCSGNKETFKVITETGRQIRATALHPFLTEEGKWIPLGWLRVGMRVQVNVGQSRGKRGIKQQYQQVDVNYHPHQATNGGIRHKVPVHRAVIEAEMNDLSYDAFIAVLRRDQARSASLAFLDRKQIVHHKDQNLRNNTRRNLVVVESAKEHADEHCWSNHVLYQIGVERIVSITAAGKESTYDIEMSDSPHNFLANGFVVHNTGKTSTILESLNYAQESSILMAAFNKGIADELRSRVENPSVQVKTLHALGFGMIMKAWPGTKVSEENERATQLVARVFGRTIPDGLISTARQLHTKVRESAPWCHSAEEVCTIAADCDLIPDAEWEGRGWPMERLAIGTLDILEAACEQSDVIDFADMIFLPLVNRWAAPKYSLVLVDEAQDMSKPQLELAQKVLRVDGRLIAVGDDKQAIYGFRGADSGSLDRLLHELNAKELGLKITFRCPLSVVREAQTLVPDLQAWGEAKEGTVQRVGVVGKPQPGAFVLSRTNAPLVAVCRELLRQGQPAVIKGKDIGRGLAKIIKKHYVKDIDAFLAKLDKWLTNEESRLARLPREARHAQLARVYDQVAVLSAIAESVETTDQLQAKVLELFSDTAAKNAVLCSTVHKAKGLESDDVWVLQDTWTRQGNEEDNLRYVAMTRAKDRLSLVSARCEGQGAGDNVAV